jgi:hypothetical protein
VFVWSARSRDRRPRRHARSRRRGLPAFLAHAGFPRVERYGRLRTGFGSLDLLEARE